MSVIVPREGSLQPPKGGSELYLFFVDRRKVDKRRVAEMPPFSFSATQPGCADVTYLYVTHRLERDQFQNDTCPSQTRSLASSQQYRWSVLGLGLLR